MTIEELIVEGNKNLHKDETKLIISSITGLNPLELYNLLDKEINESETNKILKSFKMVKENKPIQYAIGKTNFYGYDFIVNEKVLIPRFETEELVENTIKLINKYFLLPLNILDIGTGSGNIGITLKKELKNVDVTLLDISKESLEVAKQNANLHNVEVKFIESDMLNNVKEKYDVIISNPPYISYDEPIEDIVKDNEPHLALYADNEGLHYYEEILKKVENYTNEKYLIAFEIGYQQKDAIVKMINKYLQNVDIITKKDLSSRDRMIFILKK